MGTATLLVTDLVATRSLLVWVVLEIFVTLAWLFFQFKIAKNWYAIARLLRLCIIPYLALLLGQISPRGMGLAGYDWSSSLSLGSLLVVAMFTLWIGVRAASDAPSAEVAEQSALSTNSLSTWSEKGLLFLLAGGLEFNWIFWRTICTQVLGTWLVPMQSPAYWGIAIATMIVLPDTLRATSSQVTRIMNVAILIATSVLFLFTRNYWLCWILHLLLRWTTPQLPE